jgi:hypothetical protein
MNFQNLPIGSLDFSPHAASKQIAFILNESNLQSATDAQLERFWSVFYSERSSTLKEVTFVLRPLLDEDGSLCLTGINTFLQYFRDRVAHPKRPTALKIYVDTDSETVKGTRFILFEVPVLLYDSCAPSQPRHQATTGVLAELISL